MKTRGYECKAVHHNEGAHQRFAVQIVLEVVCGGRALDGEGGQNQQQHAHQHNPRYAGE